MESIAPPLKLILALRSGLERGESVRSSAQKYIATEDDELSRLVATWMLLKNQGSPTDVLFASLKSPHRRAVLMMVERGLAGETIYPTLSRLEEEVIAATNSELEEFVALLPIKMLIPLLFFQFPAFLLLLFGPLLLQFLEQV